MSYEDESLPDFLWEMGNFHAQVKVCQTLTCTQDKAPGRETFDCCPSHKELASRRRGVLYYAKRIGWLKSQHPPMSLPWFRDVQALHPEYGLNVEELAALWADSPHPMNPEFIQGA